MRSTKDAKDTKKIRLCLSFVTFVSFVDNNNGIFKAFNQVLPRRILELEALGHRARVSFVDSVSLDRGSSADRRGRLRARAGWAGHRARGARSELLPGSIRFAAGVDVFAEDA